MKILISVLSALLAGGLCQAKLTSNLKGFALKQKSDELQEFQIPSMSRNLGVCEENLILNSDGNLLADDPLHAWAGMRCAVDFVDDGYLPGSKAFKVFDRYDYNSGISQYLSEASMECLTAGTEVTFTMWLKLEDADGNPFACVSGGWNQPTTCPLLSFRVEKQDGTSIWLNEFNVAPSAGSWQADGW